MLGKTINCKPLIPYVSFLRRLQRRLKTDSTTNRGEPPHTSYRTQSIGSHHLFSPDKNELLSTNPAGRCCCYSFERTLAVFPQLYFENMGEEKTSIPPMLPFAVDIAPHPKRPGPRQMRRYSPIPCRRSKNRTESISFAPQYKEYVRPVTGFPRKQVIQAVADIQQTKQKQAETRSRGERSKEWSTAQPGSTTEHDNHPPQKSDPLYVYACTAVGHRNNSNGVS